MPRKASRTALGTAYLRAAHQLLDAEPHILHDPVAVRLLGEGAADRIRDAAGHYRMPGAAALRAHVVLRSRYAEDRLAAAVQRGVTQYVVLGAGFDTFALRQPAWARALKILEVDHEGTQGLKRSFMEKAGLALPENAAFARIDFEREALHEGLLRQGISPREPTFFSWLGVTMYLEEPAIDAALRSMAVFPEGSEVVLTFLHRHAAADAAAAARERLARRVESVGEVFVSAFDPPALEAKLLRAGFRCVEFLQPREATDRYFAARPPDLPAPQQTGIASAIR